MTTQDKERKINFVENASNYILVKQLIIMAELNGENGMNEYYEDCELIANEILKRLGCTDKGHSCCGA